METAGNPHDPAWEQLRRDFLASPAPRRIPREIGKAVIPGRRLTFTLFGLLFLAIGVALWWHDRDPATPIARSHRTPLPFMILFPLGGLILLIGAQIGAARRKSILRDGLPATARVESIGKTAVTINHSPQLKITLVRQDDGTKIVRRTHEEDVIDYLRKKKSRREPVPVLYDRHKPSRFLLPGTWKP